MEKINLNRILRDIELMHVKNALEFTNNNITEAAELLGLKRTALSMRLSTLGIVIERPRKSKLNKGKDAMGLFPNNPNNIEDQLWSNE